MPCHLHVPCISYPALFFSMVLITEPLHTNLSWILFCPSIFTVYFHTHSVPWEAHRCELPHRHSGPWPSRFQLDSTVVALAETAPWEEGKFGGLVPISLPAFLCFGVPVSSPIVTVTTGKWPPTATGLSNWVM